MSTSTHLGAALVGAVVATAVVATAGPTRSERRYAALDTFAQVLATVGTDFVRPVDDTQLVRNATRGLVGALDPYSTYLSPDQYRKVRQDTDGEYGGIGITLMSGELAPGQVPGERQTAAGEPVVDVVVPGSPAELMGVMPGDQLVAIDGTFTTLAGEPVPALARWDKVLRGASGTRVRLTVRRLGWRAARDISVVRAQLKIPTVQGLTLERGIGYVAIARFAEATAADVDRALAALRKAGDLRALVLDLRGDPGGLVDAGVATADIFLSSGTIVTVHGRGADVERHVAHDAGTYAGFPAVCLVDEGTASAAEIVVGALRDHRRCTVVGMPTYGKGSVQTFFDLPDGGGLKLTTALYRSPDGHDLEGTGITPDVEIMGWSEEIVLGDDGQDPPEGTPEGTDDGKAPTSAPQSAPGEDVAADATIAAALRADPQVTAALEILRRALASSP